MKKPNRRKTSLIGNVYKRVKEYNKEYSLNEKARLRLIKDFEVGEEVDLKYKQKSYKGTVIRINIKTYTVMFDYGKVLICKDGLSGILDSVKYDYTGDGRRFVNANVKLIKYDNSHSNQTKVGKMKNNRIVNIYSPVCTGKSKYLESLKFPLDKTMIIDFKGDKAFRDKLSKAKIIDTGLSTKEDISRAINIVRNEIKFGDSEYFIIDDASLLSNHFDEVYKIAIEAVGKDIVIIIASQEPICENISILRHLNFLEQKEEINNTLAELL